MFLVGESGSGSAGWKRGVARATHADLQAARTAAAAERLTAVALPA